jgi:hypothetical protein
MRPKDANKMVVETLNPIKVHSNPVVCPWCNGLTSMPRKMAGSEIIRIVKLMVAINMLNVMLDEAIH